MQWKYYNPKLEYEEKLDDLAWPWAGHRFFAYDLVRNFNPHRIVELGTHYGTSLWSFSQAVKDKNINTEINAIDTWKGEKHAGFYGEEVFKTVNDIKNKYYSDLKINLIRKTFDEARGFFEDNSVDVLHIDGLHTYEAVKYDFESWLPKLKKDGIVIFHDIKVVEKDFGVYKFWQELKKRYTTIEFHHSYGLGIVFFEPDIIRDLGVTEEELQIHYSYIHETKRSQTIQTKDEIINNLKLMNKKEGRIFYLFKTHTPFLFRVTRKVYLFFRSVLKLFIQHVFK